MLVRTPWNPWEAASYRNNMLPFSIIIKLHLYKAETPAALGMSQKVGATSVSLSRWHSPKTSSVLALLVFLDIDLHAATGFSAPDCE